MLYLKPGVPMPDVRRSILERYAGSRQVFVLTNEELKAYILKVTDQWFGLTSVQIAVAVLVAILGIVTGPSEGTGIRLARARERAAREFAAAAAADCTSGRFCLGDPHQHVSPAAHAVVRYAKTANRLGRLHRNAGDADLLAKISQGRDVVLSRRFQLVDRRQVLDFGQDDIRRRGLVRFRLAANRLHKPRAEDIQFLRDRQLLARYKAG